jgi:hypothetical protein
VLKRHAFFSVATIDMRARSRLIRLVLLAIVMATAVPLRAQEGRAVQQVAGAERLLARSRVVVGGAIFESKTIALQPDDLDAGDAGMPRPPVQVRLSIVNFDEAVFGPASGTTFDPAVKRQLLTALLARKVSDVERVCELTADQRKKLELAGRGDLYRLFEQIEDLRLRCQAVCEHDQEQNAMTLLLEWGKSVLREIQPLKAALGTGPFGERSLFAKTLAGMISPGQLAEFRRQQAISASQPAQPLNGGGRPAVPLPHADRNARLAEVLAEWEKAASRIDRLDCQFTRFKYDRTFEVEWRGKGSLVVEKTGRAMYRIEPEPIQPAAVGKKLGAGGAPYTLKSDTIERWHWTGKSLIHVSEIERTFEEIDWEAVRQFPLASPFLLGMPAAEMKDRFQIELKSETDTEVWLAWTPKKKKDQENLTQAILILSKDQYRPRALKMLDPTGAETVHVFKDVEINRPDHAGRLGQPNLQGYRRVLNEPAR